MSVKSNFKKSLYLIIPLLFRKKIAIWIDRQLWIEPDRRNWWSQEIVRDLAVNDVTAYHKFQWANHLGYAETYDIAQRFGFDNFNRTRHLFFDDMMELVDDEGQGKESVKSVFDVGCSLGYHLRYMETDLFPAADSLEGIDIDEVAIQSGQKYLQTLDSAITLHCGDMEALNAIIQGRTFNLVTCCGTLMYLTEDAASNLVEKMLEHTDGILAFTGLAHPEMDNTGMDHSETRSRDGTWIHNIDTMVSTAGGVVLKRRWMGAEKIDGNSVYFIFCQKVDNTAGLH